MTLEVASSSEPSTAPRPVPAYSWYVLGLLTFCYLLAAVDRSAISVVVEPIRAEFQLSDSQIGFVVGLAFGLPFALMGFPFGLIIDRVNRRNLLSGVIALWSVLTVLAGFSQSYIHLVLARMAVGAAEAGYPAAPSIITDYFATRRRPMALGIFLSGGSLAYLLTFALGGWVAQTWGWREVFFVVGAPGLVVSLILFLTVREPERGGTEEQAQKKDDAAPPFLTTIRHVFSTRSFVHLFIGYALSATTVSTFYAWSSSLLIRVHGLPIRDAGLWIAIGAGVPGFIGSLVGAATTGRLGARGMKPVLYFIAAAAFIVGPFGLIMSLAPTLPVVIASMAVVGLAITSYWGPLQGIMLSLAKVRMRGVTVSLLNVTGTLVGFGGGPLIAGAISQLLGGGGAVRYGLATVFALSIWAAFHFWMARKTLLADLGDPTGDQA